MPCYDDEELGFSYFRYGLEDADNSNLTLPRTYFGRSQLSRVNFVNTDLSESRMCWNDFDECDFSGSDLSRCDMRASIFKNCKFVGTVLRGADLRRSSFEGCDFTGANLAGAVAEHRGSEGAVYNCLSHEQRAGLSLAESGPEPPGG
jgi:uncharacterized protein YjbI with pentapeptide repeats